MTGWVLHLLGACVAAIGLLLCGLFAMGLAVEGWRVWQARRHQRREDWMSSSESGLW